MEARSYAVVLGPQDGISAVLNRDRRTRALKWCGWCFMVALLAVPALAHDREHIYETRTLDGHRARIAVKLDAQPLLTASSPQWRRENASIVVTIVDGPSPMTVWARPSFSVAGIPGRGRYVTMRAKYRAPGDTEDDDRSAIPGVRLSSLARRAVRHVRYELPVGSGVGDRTSIDLDIAVRGDGTATVSVPNPAHPFSR